MVGKKKVNPKTKGCGCTQKQSTRLGTALMFILACVTFVASVVWVVTEFRDFNRYEFYTFQGYEATLGYKLDKKTGKVTGVFNLQEFDLEKFKAEDKTIKHWNWSFLAGEHYLPMPMEERQQLFKASNV